MMCNNPNLDLININAYIKFGENLSICSQNIEQKQILAQIKGHNSNTSVQKMTCNNLKLDIVNINAYIKLVKICQFFLKILSGNEILS